MRIIIGAILTVPLLFPMFGFPNIIPIYVQFGLATIVQFGIGYKFYIGTYRALKRGKADMDTLVAIGTSAAYGLSVWSTFTGQYDNYYEVGAVLIVLISLGRMLESRSKKAARSGMESLFKLQVDRVTLFKDGDWHVVSIEEVKNGDRLLIKSGETVPVDGTVVKGEALINESMLTGESVSVHKGEGDRVFAGTLNGNQAIEITTGALGSETALGRIIALVEAATATRPKIQTLVSKVTAVFVPSVIGVSVLTFFLWWLIGGVIHLSIYPAVAVLVVACPCALGLATPMVIMVATSLGAKRGILIKNADSFQKGEKLDTLVLDKTGTITEGKLQITHVEGNFSLAIALAKFSNHPLSETIAAYQKVDVRAPTDVHAYPGKGVSGLLDGEMLFLGSPAFLQENGIEVPLPDSEKTIVAFGNKNESGYFLFEDKMKEGIHDAVETLKKIKVDVGVLSGDREPVVEAVAKDIGASFWFGGVLPDEKAGKVQALQGEGKKVGMVGDGINDAPALVQADVGLAMGSGADVAMENADIGLMRAELDILPDTITLCRKTVSKMKQNLLFAFLFNGIGIPIAAAGLLNPMIAGIAMGLSSICVVLNAVLLKTTFHKK